MSLQLSIYHIVGNHMSRLNYTDGCSDAEENVNGICQYYIAVITAFINSESQ